MTEAARQKFYDKCGRYLFIASACLMTILIFSIIIFIGRQGLLTFGEVSPLEFFFSAAWDPSAKHFGALSFIMGSLLSTLVAVAIGTPLGLSGAIFLAKVAPDWLKRIMRPACDLYVAIPSVVYGYMGLILLVPILREYLHLPTGFGVMAASLVLAIMIMPTILTISTDALNAVPKALGEASLALGATWWQTIWHVVLPAARPGIMTAIVLAMARAVGETMAVQMLIGNTPQLATSLFMPTATLTSDIVVEMGNTPFGSAWGNALFLMAFVLLILSLGMILLIRKFSQRSVA
ncbi:MAG: phosphate ABC transporter permease subunit PstC [Selenomonas sp.]|nr:phosphate ABC transporter permease subunit PstC [Selenomonas sp.]MCI7329839.1 phosphate ABC transporter permease subunit PstC [Selenomonadaceae bacterium]MDD6119867.1 phosphate ABC transporter permease subunit PstC [Selenomonadaceae bacterium]MDD7056471.1 phosphate ABC transporter permease subunit PstC [Selenomonadaceae bacterium]HBT78962.1 phosphate ABC transporter permease subunit PstC [Selenomonas sp.]